jgi:hypothetical protein
MLKFTHKLKVNSRVVAKCSRHPRYNPEKQGRGAIVGGCSGCFALFDLMQSRNQLDAAVREFERLAAPWYPPRKPRPEPKTGNTPEAHA